MRKVYSENGDNFNSADPEQVALGFFDRTEETEFEIFVGDIDKETIGDFFTISNAMSLVEQVGENQFDLAGETADIPDRKFTTDEIIKLKQAVKKTLDNWADDIGFKTKVFNAINIKTIKCEIIDGEAIVHDT